MAERPLLRQIEKLTRQTLAFTDQRNPSTARLEPDLRGDAQHRPQESTPRPASRPHNQRPNKSPPRRFARPAKAGARG
ncbi:MAG: hypothetical protein POG24_06495, partial [Acidocella sp.]|nr:hypothetical protein [Acidocella sp.]